MLVLKRAKNEVIRVGDDISIMVVGIDEKSVKLGIDAPKSVPVHRQEVYDAVHQNDNTLRGETS
jgi:carbon storage regulator